MKLPIFIDTSYFLALLNKRDKYHQAATLVMGQLSSSFVTSDAVLFELGNALARPPFRLLATQALAQIQNDPSIEIINVDDELFVETTAFFQARSDQTWGLTDCSSFLIMQKRGLREALTADKHFEQAGFVRLLHL